MSGSEWVKARAKCSATSVFERLRLEVRSDVDTRKALNQEAEPSQRFEFVFTTSADEFSVCVQRLDYKRVVTFSVENGAIKVADEAGKVTLKGAVALSDDGVCRIRVADLELDSWQFRRRALERLFFELPGDAQ